MANRPSLDDYVDVAERIQDFKDAHPDGSLQTIGWEVATVEGIDAKTQKPVKRTFVVYRAAAYRTANDPTPGQGIAWEPFPGGTPYTRDSELMNAETAAWGRAICALGLVANRSLASRQEVRNRRADQDAAVSDPQPISAPPTPDAEIVPDEPQDNRVSQGVLDQLRAKYVEKGFTENELCWFLLSVGVENLPAEPSKADIGEAMRSLTLEQACRLDDAFDGRAEYAADDSVPGSGETA